jgi:hypothetical protein
MNNDFQVLWQAHFLEDSAAHALDVDVVHALWLWLDGRRAQNLSQFGSGNAAVYSEAVERSHGVAHHPCIVDIREQLQQIVSVLTQSGRADSKSKMREIDKAFVTTLWHERELKNLITVSEGLRVVLQETKSDLHHHSAALSIRLTQWRISNTDKNPLSDDTVRNDTAERRAQSLLALIQSCHTSQLQLSLMCNQMSRLLENLTTLRQVTYPIWQQQAIHQTMADDQAFLTSLQQTLNAVK